MNHEAEGNTEDAAELNLGEGELSLKLVTTRSIPEERRKSTDRNKQTNSGPLAVRRIPETKTKTALRGGIQLHSRRNMRSRY
jgi:hypothetical protein